VRRHLFPDGLAQQVPQVPPIPGLHRARQHPADRLAVGPRPVTANDPGSRVVSQPLLRSVGGAALDHVDAPAGLGVDEHRRVDAPAAQREVVDSQHPRHRQGGQRNAEQDPQHRVPGGGDAQHLQQACRGAAR
jgi:hypothetical protein